MSMSTIEKVSLLRDTELFGEVPGEVLADVAQIAREVHFHAGERFIRQGDIGNCLYIIADGEADIVLGSAGKIGHRRARSVIGEMAVLSHRPRSANCIAVTDLTLLEIDRDDFWKLMDAQPKLVRGAISVLASRLSERLEDLQRRGSDASR